MTVDLTAEFAAAQRQMTRADRAEVEALGIAPGLGLFLVGIERIHEHRGGLYEPAPDGKWAFLTPVRVDTPISPESSCWRQTTHFGDAVDIVAWTPARPDIWATRTGAGEWLGSVEPQLLGPARIQVHRSPLHWLQAGATGLVVLAKDAPTVYRLLSGCQSGIDAEDDAHAREILSIVRRPWPIPSVGVVGRRRAA